MSRTPLSFAAIPGTIEQRLTGATDGSVLPLDGLPDRFDRILFVYLDAFAWRFLARHSRHPLIARAGGDGLVLQLASQFPSTTAAHTTTLHSGLPVGVHGVYEWFVLEPSLNRLIAPLLFSYAGDGERDTLVGSGLEPDAVFPVETLHMRLAAAGVRSVAAVPAPIARTATNQMLTRGAALVGFDNTAAGFAAASTALARSERVVASVYLSSFDALMHQVGPDHRAADAELVRLLTDVAEALVQVPADTLVLVGSDHGMAPISPERTVYVNVAWPELSTRLQQGADSKPLAPAGSCRDLFLHVQPGEVDVVVAELSERLAHVADVVTTQALLDEGVFGPERSPAFLDRLAEVVVLPHDGEAVWWLEPGRFEQRFRGQHGGLSADEVDIPLLALLT